MEKKYAVVFQRALSIELDITYYKKCNEKPHPHSDSESKNSNTFIKG